MKKLFKILIIFFLITGVLFASGLLLLRKLLPPEKVKERIAQEVSARFNREIELGKIQIGLLKGIVVEDFAFSEFPNFKNGTFVESKQFSLKFQILPLLKKKVIIDQIELKDPKIRIVRNGDGKTFNFSDLVKPSPAPTPSPTPSKDESSPLAITVSKAVISNGKVEFIDKSAQKMKLVISPIHLNITGTGLTKPMAVKLSFNLDSFLLGKDLRGKLEVSSVVDLPKETVQIESHLWAMDLLTLQVKGKVESFKKPKLDLDVKIPKVDLKALKEWVALPKEIKVSVTPNISLLLKGTQERLNYSATVKLDPIEMTIDGLLKLHPNNIDPTIQAAFKVNPFDLKEAEKLTDLAAPYAPSGKVSLSGEVSGPLKLLQAKGTLRLENVQAKYKKINVQSLSGAFEFTDNSLNVPLLTGQLSSQGKTPCDFKIKTSVDNFLKPHIFLDARLTTLDLGLFVSEKKKEAAKEKSVVLIQGAAKPYKGPEISSEGKLTVSKFLYTKFEGEKLSASWSLSGATPNCDKLDGKVTVESKQGKIFDMPILKVLAPILKTDPSSFGYSYLGGNWNVTKGLARTEDFKVLSAACDLFLKGSLSLPNKAPDLTITAKLPKGSLGGTLGDLSTDSEGRPTFIFLIKNSWKPALDTSQVKTKAVEKAKEEIKKKASEFLENEGKKLFKDLFGK